MTDSLNRSDEEDAAEVPYSVSESARRVAAGERLDGVPVGSGTDSDSQALLERLRELERIAAFHTAGQGDWSAVSAPDAWGSLQILEEIGRGAYGRVYRAGDPGLERHVALKLLLPEVAERPGVAQHFITEGRHLARLRHRNIVSIHRAEEIDGRLGLEMELIEGRTLAAIVAADGPFASDEAALIGRDISRALAAVHKAGLVHRDVKAQNVMRETGGRVVLMDLGAGRDAASVLESGAVGTPLYVAPELLEGQSPTSQSDLYGLGVLLYYLVTGTFPVAAGTVDELRNAHQSGTRLHLRDARPDLPDPFVRLIERAVDPDPAKRPRSAGEFETELSKALGQTEKHPSRSSRLAVATAGALAFLAVVATIGWWRATRAVTTAPQPLVWLNHDLGPGVNLGNTSGAPSVVISPDGMSLVYVSQRKLFLQRLGQEQATALEGTDGAGSPFFKPDGQWVGFFQQRKLKKVALDGGHVVELVSDGMTPAGNGASWGEDGVIVLAPSNNRALSRVPDSGGVLTPATELGAGDLAHVWPQVLPGAKGIVYTVRTAGALTYARVEVLSLADGRRTLVGRGTFGRYLKSGHVLYVDNTTLFARRFDLDRLAPVGDPWPIMTYSADLLTGAAQFDVSNKGTFVYRDMESGVIMQWFDASGRTAPLLTVPAAYTQPRVSPDGSRIGVTLTTREGDQVLVYEPGRDLPTVLTHPGDRYRTPVWTPDSQYLVYGGPGGLWWSRADGSDTPKRLLLEDKSSAVFPVSFSRDTWRLAYDRTTVAGSTNYDIVTVPVHRDVTGLRAGAPEVFLATPEDERHGALSPDGRWIAYTSVSGAVRDIYVKPFPDSTGARWQVSTQGGVYPKWSFASDEIFFRAQDNRVMVVPFTTDAHIFVPGRPRVWSPTQLADMGMRLSFDFAPDGRRIAGLFQADPLTSAGTSHHVHVLFNFFDEVRRREQ